MSAVELLPFPPPYRAALALSNDLDDLLDPDGWWEFLRFLNTGESTRFGDGLGMEVGDSFWFYSDDPEGQPGSYFTGLTETPSPFASRIAALGRVGYLDTLHSYGNFSRHGGFRREHAVRAGEVLRQEGFAPTVWVNHGGAHDFQNLVMGCGDVPENPEAAGAPAPEYHLDLTWKLGMRYAWVGELTTVSGQDRPLSLREWVDPRSSVPREALGVLRRGLSRRLAYRDVLRTYPNYAAHRNRLTAPRRLRDGTVVQTFVRHGDFRRAGFSDLAWLLHGESLDRLEASGGFSIRFVHWNRHPGRSFAEVDPRGLDALRELARRVREKRLWVTTTGRLLAYAEARRAVRVSSRIDEGGAVRIALEADPLPDGRRLGPGDLAGLCFRVPDPARAELTWNGDPLPVEPVPGEPGTVWIPWTPLRFPEPPDRRAG